MKQWNFLIQQLIPVCSNFPISARILDSIDFIFDSANVEIEYFVVTILNCLSNHSSTGFKLAVLKLQKWNFETALYFHFIDDV